MLTCLQHPSLRNSQVPAQVYESTPVKLWCVDCKEIKFTVNLDDL